MSTSYEKRKKNRRLLSKAEKYEKLTKSICKRLNKRLTIIDKYLPDQLTQKLKDERDRIKAVLTKPIN